MGVFHVATITPTKEELLAAWIPTQPWGPGPDAEVSVIGAFRFDDPENLVGIETHLCQSGDTVFQVPLTYRNEPLDGADTSFIGEMEHSALGTRHIYDGLGDPRYLLMLTAVALTGQGEALGMAVFEDRWYIAPANVRIHGGGWGQERVPIDGMEPVSTDGDRAVFRNDRFDLTVFRRPASGPHPPIGLTADWDGGDPVVLAEVVER
ncbi:MAG: hypothetical protein AAGA65_02920 [Actinomycetota bacterium]